MCNAALEFRGYSQSHMVDGLERNSFGNESLVESVGIQCTFILFFLVLS